MKFIAWCKRMWYANQHHWDIEAGLRMTNEEALQHHKQMYEALSEAPKVL